MSQEQGKINESKVKKYYENQGYTVLNQNDSGFPDLLILEGKKLVKLVEVKTPKHPVHKHQKDYLRSLKALGFEVEITVIVDDEVNVEIL